MYETTEVLTALQQRVDAAHVAHLFSSSGQRLGDGYNIKAPFPQVKEVIVNLKIGSHLLTLPPESVDYTFAEPYGVTLEKVAPFCKDWTAAPSQREKPWLYLCRLDRAKGVSVVVYASLTGDIHSGTTRVRELSLQADF